MHRMVPYHDIQDLWIDLPDAASRLDALGLAPGLRADVAEFIDKGYLVVPGAVPHDVIDRVVDDTQRVLTDPSRYVVRLAGKYVDPAGIDALGKGHRIIDLYAVSAAAREATFTPRIAALLHAIFGEPAIAIQSLSFEYGSQQAIHQDTAYVVSQRPTALAAIWIALEDIAEGSGELIYYPGGHRFEHFLFGGERKHYNAKVDGPATHQRFLEQLHEQARERNLAQERFLARKGDVLLWHADLPHGGSRIVKNVTRRSLVLHFVPLSVKPNFKKIIGEEYHELVMDHGHAFASRHFRLRDVDALGRAPVLFDGGASGLYR